MTSLPSAARRWTGAAALAVLTPVACARARASDEAGVTVRPGRDLRVYVEPWDATTLAAAGIDPGADDPGADDGSGGVPAPHLATFTVVLELANRPPRGRVRAHVPGTSPGAAAPADRSAPAPWGDDPLIDPATWAFELDAPGLRAVPADRVTLLAADRFPIPGGGAHWRLALAVTFRARGGDPAKPAHPPRRHRDRPHGNTWTLHIRPAVDVRPRRHALGTIARHGVRVALP